MSSIFMSQHVCENIERFPLNKFHQLGGGRGRRLLVVGESPAPTGWVVSGIACYNNKGKILPTGSRLNELLGLHGLSVERVGFTELSKCFVSKRSELEECCKKCWPIFLKQIEEARYRLLVILGVETTRIFSKIIGSEMKFGKLNHVKLNRRSYAILPIYHPSPINPHGRAKNASIFRKNRRSIELLLDNRGGG